MKMWLNIIEEYYLSIFGAFILESEKFVQNKATKGYIDHHRATQYPDHHSHEPIVSFISHV